MSCFCNICEKESVCKLKDGSDVVKCAEFLSINPNDYTKNTGMTDLEIKEFIEKLDIINRPWVIFVRPEDAENIKKAFPQIEEKYFLQVNPFVEKGKVIAVQRKELEQWEYGLFGKEQE